MKAVTFQEPYVLKYGEVADPVVREPGDVVVRVAVAAVCGSDLHVYRGHETGLDVGTVMGHEFVGEVVERGSAASGLEIGSLVVSPFTTSCGDCFYCRRELTARCTQGALFGWVEGGVGLHGAQAELVRVPLAASTLGRVPDGLDAESALLAGDVLATGFYCAESGGVESGSVVAVLGCGPVGIMAIVGARELGADVIYAIDGVAERLELAREFGAVPVNLSDEPVATLIDATEGRGVDVVLEAVGSPQASRLALDLVRPGGTIAAVGVHTEEHFAFSPVEAYDKNLTYRAGRCPVRPRLERMLDLIASGRYDFGKIISHRMPLSEGVRAYEIFDQKLDGCTKVVLAG